MMLSSSGRTASSSSLSSGTAIMGIAMIDGKKSRLPAKHTT